MGAQKKVKKSNESINSRLALVMKSGKYVLAGIQADPENAEEWEEQAGDHCQQYSPFEEVWDRVLYYAGQDWCPPLVITLATTTSWELHVENTSGCVDIGQIC